MYKKNDRLHDVRFGWGTVESTTSKNEFNLPLLIRFDTGYRTNYTEDGRPHYLQERVLSFTDEYVKYLCFERPLPKLAKGDPVYVRNDDQWHYRMFSHFSSRKGRIFVLSKNGTSVPWKEWSITPPQLEAQ